MACFIVPGTEAVVSTIATKIIEKNEVVKSEGQLKEGMEIAELNKVKLSARLKRLNGLLWGGSALLAFEHLWHGEIQPFFPFLTAARNPVDFAEVIHEMSTVGVGMAVFVTAVWATVEVVLHTAEKKTAGSEAVVKNK